MEQLKISRSIIPADWQPKSQSHLMPSIKGGGSSYPNGMSKEEWEHSYGNSMRKWYAEKKVSQRYINETELHRIDNMNRHLFTK